MIIEFGHNQLRGVLHMETGSYTGPTVLHDTDMD